MCFCIQRIPSEMCIMLFYKNLALMLAGDRALYRNDWLLSLPHRDGQVSDRMSTLLFWSNKHVYIYIYIYDCLKQMTISTDYYHYVYSSTWNFVVFELIFRLINWASILLNEHSQRNVDNLQGAPCFVNCCLYTIWCRWLTTVLKKTVNNREPLSLWCRWLLSVCLNI